MKSNKQRRAELDQKRADRRKKEAATKKATATARRETQRRRWEELGIAVNPDDLAPDNSYSVAPFVERGYYVDIPFRCKDCGKDEVWAATQQKWWYEVAKGGRWTTAIRCRACRRRQREKAAKARRVHLEGLARKK